jgi:hypothetical protein
MRTSILLSLAILLMTFLGQCSRGAVVAQKASFHPEWKRTEDSTWHVIDPSGAQDAVIARCRPRLQRLSGEPLLVLPHDNPIGAERYVLLINLAITESGEVARFQVLAGPDDPSTISSISKLLVTWRYAPCVVNNQPHSVYAKAALRYEPI